VLLCLTPARASARVFCPSYLIDFARLRDPSRANKVDWDWVSPWPVTWWSYTVAISERKVLVRSRALLSPWSCRSQLSDATRSAGKSGKERLKEGVMLPL